MKRLILIVVLLACTGGIVLAGWMRQNGKTSYSTEPTPASLLTRDSRGDLYPNRYAHVYQETLYAAPHSGSAAVPFTGYCALDSNGDVYPNAGVAEYANRGNVQSSCDVECDVDSSGDVYPKD